MNPTADFYFLCIHLPRAKRPLETFGIQGPESYVYTSKSGCLDVASIDDREDFAETLKAMNVVGLSAEEQEQIFRCLAMVLWCVSGPPLVAFILVYYKACLTCFFRCLSSCMVHRLGNVQFEENADGNSIIPDEGVTEFISYLMEVDKDAVNKVLTTRVMETQRGGRRGEPAASMMLRNSNQMAQRLVLRFLRAGSIYDVPLNVAQAGAGRDALAKAICEFPLTFTWL